MKKTSLLVVMLLILSLATYGCGSKGQTGAAAGALGGALLGQAIGHNTAGTLIGAAVGAGAGYLIGNEMDKSDAAEMEQAYRNRVGETTNWRNSNTGDEYSVTPKRRYHDRRSNRECVDAEILATVNGRPKRVIQPACYDERGNLVAVQ
ncbi:glycine zipper domain-containing protein [Candidatus Gracilibacteria bacterium]|nr:glycine zipper domain-containing protein [Candidatus Gracilibacteria bacterium]